MVWGCQIYKIASVTAISVVSFIPMSMPNVQEEKKNTATQARQENTVAVVVRDVQIPSTNPRQRHHTAAK